ncbi:MAG TPA: glutathione S-transferase family protein [Caulobacteraceae bacterium]
MMITLFGGGMSRAFRVVWLLEEMGLPYNYRSVNLLADELDADFLAANPAGFLPTLQDGETTMVESLAIMQYLMARYGPTPLAPATDDPAFPAYQQFLHLGEAGLGVPLYIVSGSRNFAPEDERENWGAGFALEIYESRLTLVTRQLARSPYLAGETFTAADISVSYVFVWASRYAGITLGDAEQAYIARTAGRDAFKRAFEKSQAAMVRS